MKSEYLDTLKNFVEIINSIDWKIILSIISLFIAIRLNRIFYRRELRKKQIDLVIELVQNIQKKPIWLRLMKISDSSSGFLSIDSGSLFAISRNAKIATQKELKNLTVYFTEETIDRIKITDFLTNPLLPKGIADALKTSFRPENIHSEIKNFQTDYILLDESRTLDAKSIKQDFPLEQPEYLCTNHIEFSQFILGLIKLRIEINKWFKNSGIKDLNIYWEE